MRNQLVVTPSTDSPVSKYDSYRAELFLEPAKIRTMLGIGENLLYEYLKNPPFRTERVGTKILIHSKSFWKWYDEC